MGIGMGLGWDWDGVGHIRKDTAGMWGQQQLLSLETPPPQTQEWGGAVIGSVGVQWAIWGLHGVFVGVL